MNARTGWSTSELKGALKQVTGVDEAAQRGRLDSRDNFRHEIRLCSDGWEIGGVLRG